MKITLVFPMHDTPTETMTLRLKWRRLQMSRLAGTLLLRAVPAYTVSFGEFTGVATVNFFSSVNQTLRTLLYINRKSGKKLLTTFHLAISIKSLERF